MITLRWVTCGTCNKQFHPMLPKQQNCLPCLTQKLCFEGQADFDQYDAKEQRKMYTVVARFIKDYEKLFNLPDIISYREEYFLTRQELLTDRIRDYTLRKLDGDIIEEHETAIYDAYSAELKDIDAMLEKLDGIRKDLPDVMKITVSSTKTLRALLDDADDLPVVDSRPEEMVVSEQQFLSSLERDLDL